MTTRLGSPTGALSGVVTGASFVAGILSGAKLAKTRIPMPGAPVDDVRRYYADSGTAVRVSVAGEAVSILSLIRFTSTVAGLEKGTDRQSRIVRAVIWASGLGSATCLTVSATTAARLAANPDVDDDTVLRRARRVFVAGGPVHAVPYGVFIAALGIAGRRAGIWDRPAVATAAVSAASSLLSPAYFRWENAGWLIPIGRFSGYTLSGLAGMRIARR